MNSSSFQCWFGNIEIYFVELKKLTNSERKEKGKQRAPRCRRCNELMKGHKKGQCQK